MKHKTEVFGDKKMILFFFKVNLSKLDDQGLMMILQKRKSL